VKEQRSVDSGAPVGLSVKPMNKFANQPTHVAVVSEHSVGKSAYDVARKFLVSAGYRAA
jgi:hypothetical protein